MELEKEEEKKTAWEKEVSDLAEHQIVAVAASTKACKKFDKLKENRASAESFLEKTEEQFKRYEKMVTDTTEAEEDVDDLLDGFLMVGQGTSCSLSDFFFVAWIGGGLGFLLLLYDLPHWLFGFEVDVLEVS